MAVKSLSWGIVAGLALAGCTRAQVQGPSRDGLVAELRQEADALKKSGEDIDPSVGVKATWTAEAVDVRERAGDKDFPWAGTIRFKIRSDSREADGSVTTDSFEKRFEYRYSSALKRWIIDVPAPTPKTP